MTPRSATLKTAYDKADLYKAKVGLDLTDFLTYDKRTDTAALSRASAKIVSSASRSIRKS